MEVLVRRRRNQVLLFFLLALLFYLPTASYSLAQNVDTEAAATPAWTLVRTGAMDVAAAPRSDPRFYFDVEDRVYSNRFPGTVLYAVPAYMVFRAAGIDHVWMPGAFSASVVSAAAGALMLALLLQAMPSARTAWLASLFFAFGTATWAVSADAQWPHGIDQLLIVAGMLAMMRERSASAGLLLGLTVFVRPQMALAVLVVGVVGFWYGRSWGHLARYGSAALLGLVALIAYHGLVLGSWSVDNGHAQYAAGEGLWSSIAQTPANVAGTLFDPMRGVLILYPALLVTALGLAKAWSGSAPWVKATALGGVVALLTQLGLNRYSGGDAFFGSRLTIEALTLAYPLLVASWCQSPERARRVGVPLLAVSVVLHSLGAVAYPYVQVGALPLVLTTAIVVLVSLGGFIAARPLVERLARSSSSTVH